MAFLDYLKEEFNYTETENGAVALNSTMNACLDAFGSMGAMKFASDDQIVDVFKNAFYEDRATAMRILFYIRDVRGGQGMRRVFRVCLSWLAVNYPEYVINNLDNILEYGRGDDFICLLNSENYTVNNDVAEAALVKMAKILTDDYDSMKNGGQISLLSKWAWSINTSSRKSRALGRRLCKTIGCSERSYRKMLSALRSYSNVVEKKMSANKWNEIEYDKVPGAASLRYSNAFMKHDEDGYLNYIKELAKDPSKAKANTLFPADVVKGVLDYRVSNKDKILYNAYWEALPNYFEGREETGICMCDTSGSMNGEPLLVSLSLGLYCADKCKGPFKNHFITFDYKPELQEIKGDTIYEKVHSIRCINPWNTDLEAALQVILDTAVNNHCTNDELPKKLYIISDMQFDEACDTDTSKRLDGKKKPFMQTMRQRFEDAGYEFPAIVYWNVRASKCGMWQETFQGENCCMVSGYSASLFKAVAEGTEIEKTVNEKGETVTKQKLDPLTVMFKTISNERYDKVWAG